MLDNLQPTAAGHMTDCQHGISGWQHPYSIRRLPYLFNVSLATSTVPRRWKEARICLLSKVPAPRQHADYRPSHTPIMSRLMERTVVHTFLCTAFLNPPTTLTLSDEFAFRPTGSTSAATISLLHTVTDLLQYNPFIVVIYTWTFPRHLTPSNTLHCCPSWLLWTCRRQSTTDCQTSSASYRVQWRSIAYKKHHGNYHTGLGRWTSRLHCHSRRSQTTQHQQHIY